MAGNGTPQKKLFLVSLKVTFEILLSRISRNAEVIDPIACTKTVFSSIQAGSEISSERLFLSYIIIISVHLGGKNITQAELNKF